MRFDEFVFFFVANSVRQSMFVCFELGEIFLKKEGVDSLQRCDWNINFFSFPFFDRGKRKRNNGNEIYGLVSNSCP